MQNATAETQPSETVEVVCNCALSTDFGRSLENLQWDLFRKLGDYGEPDVI